MKIVSLIILSLLPVALSQNSAASPENKSDESVRVKRAGFSLITGALQNLQKGAFSASASVAAGSSSQSSGSSGSSSSGSSSSSHDTNSHSYGHENFEEPHHDTKSFDGWSLKKSILNTLLQAVKAIAGGVTSLSGQAIKGSGYLVSQKGKLIASGGDAVSNAGIQLAHSAHLIKPDSGYGGGHSSLGHSLGSSFGGLQKTISGSLSSLSSGSAHSVSSLSSGSSGHISSLSSSSSGSSSNGHSGGSDSHGETYSSVHTDGPSYSYKIPESNHYENYETNPSVHSSYGPPTKVIESYVAPTSYIHEPQSAYGVPHYNDGTYHSSSNKEAADVLSQILKNLPHKPMKSVGQGPYSSGGHSFNQIPIPNDLSPPPPSFKPLSLNDHSSLNIPFENINPLSTAYGPPVHYSDYSGQSSDKKSIAVNPNAYDAYHSMQMKSKKEKNFVTVPTFLDICNDGLEIQKSIQYELKV